jgi:hypothetical protein
MIFVELYQVTIEKHLLDDFLFYCQVHGVNPKARITQLIQDTTQVHPKIRENYDILKGLFAHLHIDPNLLQIANLLKDDGASWVHYAYNENENTRIEISFVAIMQENLIKELHPDDIHIKINDKPFYTPSQKDKLWERHLINERMREEKNKLRREYEKDLRERKAKGIKTYREMDSAERREYWFAYRKKHKINLE